MAWFVLIYVVVYGLMNSYVFARFYWGMSQMGRLRWLAVPWLLLAIAGPFLVRYADRWGMVGSAKIMGLILYSWIAIAFWFCCIGLGTDVYNLLARLLGAAGKNFLLTPRPQFILICAAVAGLVGWSAINARIIRTQYIHVSSPRLIAHTKPITIAHLSDLHLGVNVGPARFSQVIDIIRRHQPDLIVATGDLIDSPYAHLRDYAETLAQLQAPLGKYAVLGNHEYYTGLDESLAFHQAAGFRLLRQEAVWVASDIRIAGVDDPADGRAAPSLTDERAALAGDHEEFTLLLKHRPTIRADGRFDLQLSGHTHGGQIFPFHFVVLRLFPFLSGLHPLDNGANVYVNRGAGTWGPPMRLFAPPEVAIITIEPQSR